MHNIRYSTYPENVNKGEVQKEWDDFVEIEDAREGASGLPNDIRWINVTLDSYDEAYNYIEGHDNGWYDQLAVKYRSYPDFKPSKTYLTLKERYEKNKNRLNDLINKIHYSDVKSSFIGCKVCGSKISSKYIKTNYCPVCQADLRPATVLERIKAAELAVEKADKELHAELKKLREKNKKKAVIKWLVKIEYHT